MGLRDRGDSLTRALASLAAGRGVLVAGEPGSGRTYFVRQLITAADEQTRTRLWVRDDELPLDKTGHDRLLAAMAAGNIVPLITTTHGGRPDPWLHRLSIEPGLTRIDLAPLDSVSLLRIVQTTLHGKLDPSAVLAFVPRRHGGDLVVLLEAVREALSREILVRRDGAWSVTGAIPPLEGLRGTIHSRMGFASPMDPLVETVLDLTALAPQLGTARTRILLADFAHEDLDAALEQLESSGLIDVAEWKGTVRLRIHDPVIELVLPQTIGRLRRRRLSTAIVDLLSAEPIEHLSGGELSALVRLALPHGKDVDSSAITRAAEIALRASRFDVAEHLATAALSRATSIEAALALASAESQLGRSAEALLRLESLTLSAAERDQHGALRDELLGLVRARVENPDATWNLASRQDVGDGAESVSALDLVSISRADGLDDVSSPVDPAVVLEGERVAYAATVAVLGGEIDRARQMLHEVERDLERAGTDTFRVRLGDLYAQSWDRPLDESLDDLRALGDDAAARGQSGQEAMCAWSRGVVLVRAGRAAEAVGVLGPALTELDRKGLHEIALLARVSMTTALSSTGQVNAAASVLAPVRDVSVGKPLLEGWALEAHAAILLHSGHPEHAARMFLTAASSYAAHGHLLPQLFALGESALAGSPTDVLPLIIGLEARVQGSCAALVVRLVRALDLRSRIEEGRSSPGAGATDASGVLGAEFDMIGDRAADLGMHRHAAFAFGLAGPLHDSSGGARAATASSRHAAEQTALCGSASRTPFGNESVVQLSPREHEIAELACAGLSNREVADQLVLSIRTVETHLLRVYRKLGVRSRSELVAALHDGLPATGERLTPASTRPTGTTRR